MKILQQKGFVLVSAIFVIVILALIGTYIVSIAAISSSSSTFSLQGVKAYYAAKSGLEWGIYRVAPSAASGGAPPYNCPAASTTLNLTQGGLGGFTVVVTCAQSSFTESGISYNVFRLNSTATFGVLSSPDYASRQLYTTIIQPGI
jgi:MSHA biogenesis protein MshP